MISRLYIANADAQRVAEIAMSVGLSGTVIGSTIGFTPTWGTEPSLIVEMAETTRPELVRLANALFSEYPNENAVVVYHRGRSELWWRDGRTT